MAELSYKNKLQEWCQKNRFAMPCYVSECNGNNDNLLWNSTITLKVNENNYTYTTEKIYTRRKNADQEAAKNIYEKLGLSANNLVDKNDSYAAASEVKVVVVDAAACASEVKVVDAGVAAPASEVKGVDVVVGDVNPVTSPVVGPVVGPVTSPVVNPVTSPVADLTAIPQKNILVLIDLENIQPPIGIFNIPNAIYYGFMSTYSPVITDRYNSLCKIIKIDNACAEAADHTMTFYAARLTFNKTMTVIILSRDKTSAVLYDLLLRERHTVFHYKSISDMQNNLYKFINK